MLIQANSGGGKSRTIRRLLEQTAGQVQQLIIDPEGEFATLREKHDYVIAAAHDGDALAHPKTAQLLARRLLETGVSAILDIYDLKAYERQAFVRIFCETLVNAPKTLWQPALIVLDEAHMYCPEGGKAESAGAVIDLATRGRKRGFALVAATQRLAKLHKDCAAELLNKLIGRTGLDVDVRRAADELGMTHKEAMKELRPLRPGEFFAFGPALSTEVRALKVGDVKTTHPKAGHRMLKAPPKPTRAIVAILPKLADLPKEAETELRTAEDLKRELVKVRRELTLANKSAPKVDPTIVADLKAASTTIGRLRSALEALMKFVIQINAIGFDKDCGVNPGQLAKAINTAVEQATKLMDQKFDARTKALKALQQDGERLLGQVEKLLRDRKVSINLNVKHQEPFEVKRTVVSSNGSASSSMGAGGKRRILIALAQFSEGMDHRKLGILTDLSPRSGTWSTYLAELRGKGYIEGRDHLKITDEGIAAVGSYEPLPTGQELIAYWQNRLGSGGKRAIFNVVVEAFPKALAQDEVAAQCNLSAQSGTWSTYLAELRSLGLIEGRKELRASETLFQ